MTTIVILAADRLVFPLRPDDVEWNDFLFSDSACRFETVIRGLDQT